MNPTSDVEHIRNMSALLEVLAARAELARVIYYLRLAVMASALAAALATPAEAGCHRFSHWAYKFPQRCAVASHATPVRQARFVAQVKPVADKPIPTLPGPTEADLRTAAMGRLRLQLDALARR